MKDEAGDYLKAMRSGGGNSASGSIGPMIKELATSANTDYNGFSQTQLAEKPISFYCVNPFYSAFSIATPEQFMEATNDSSDVEGGYWGRVLFIHVGDSAKAINPRLIPVPEGKFSIGAAKVINHFKSLIAPRRKAWEAAENPDIVAGEPYSTEANPRCVVYDVDAADYLFETAEDYLVEERQRKDYEQIRPIAKRLGEHASKLLLLYAVSKHYDEPDQSKTPVADIEGAKICWALALEMHLEKLRQLKLNAETDYEKLTRYAIKKCSKRVKGKRAILGKDTLKSYVSRHLKIKMKDAVEHLGESGLFDLLPNNMSATSFTLKD